MTSFASPDLPPISSEQIIAPAMERGLGARASFWRRVAGTLVDYVLSGVASAAIAIGIFALLLPHVYTQAGLVRAVAAAMLLPSGLLLVYRWVANSMGGTVGKRIVGVRVVKSGSDNDPGFVTGLMRTVVAMVSGLPLGLGYLWAVWDREGKTWHDKASGTSVVTGERSGRLLLISTVLVIGLSTVLPLAFVGVSDRVGSFRIEGAAMEPTFHDKEVVWTVKRGSPGRGELIVFRFPLDPSREFIKRVIGVPGDTIEVRDGQVIVNGSPLREDYILAAPNYAYGPKTAPPGHYFVLGDNRRNSYDSHAWGATCAPQQQCDFVPEDNIIGQVLR